MEEAQSYTIQSLKILLFEEQSLIADNYKNLKLTGRTKYHRIDESGPTPINVEKLPFTKCKKFFPKNLEEKMLIRQYF